MAIEGLLRHMGDDDSGARRSEIRAFQIILALVVCTEYWTKYLARWSDLGVGEIAALAAATILATAVVHGRWRRPALASIAVLQTWYVWSLFPMAGNHRYLEAVFALWLAVLDDENGEERALLLKSLRWMAIVVLFCSGLQKLVHGYWFRGQFLAWSVWRESFRAALELVVSRDEVARLASYGWYAGQGPFLVPAPPLAWISNAVWIGEITLALLLIPRATRAAACVAAIVFIVLTEIVARELMFGVEFVAAMLLFAKGDAVRRFVAPAAVLLGALILMRLGILPVVVFH